MSGLIKRVRDITIATLNERLERAEDPVRLIDQFLWATREEIIQAERLYQQYSAHANSMRAQWLQAEQQAEKREQQAITALKAGEEHLARLALAEKQHHLERARQYKELYETSQANVNELEELIRELRSEYQTVYDKREYYVARMESLRLQQRLNERFGSVMGHPDNMFRRLDDRLTDMELEARSLREIRRSGQSFIPTGSSEQVELELEQLKRKIGKEG
ncbi:MAG: phage shock protein A [Thermobacillus sp. ZCTH02-B1]|uniref:PspA/IM30 family protein n=1 Tax=Thermobacillus sp. ZCTH02-B1 TaxID=1858795 RepID=UPI000B5637A9|nr:PspA/IM30 family protein [Thermobacillus sp. ZCTH02-B1]OUM94554.1 MAG: phage shock protein A [Thermobacillus sp. ZCTH02-B1]